MVLCSVQWKKQFLPWCKWWFLCACVRCRPGEQHRPWHTGPIHGIMMWNVRSYNNCSPLVFMERNLNSALYVQNIIQPVLLSFLKKKFICCSRRVMPNNMMPIILNMFYKMLNISLASIITRFVYHGTW